MNDEQPTLSPDFDLDAWIDGTRGITTTARILQRGDLIAERARLEDELEVTRRVEPEDRGVGDRTPESVEAELEQVEQDLYRSVLIVTLEDRTVEHRREIRDKAAKDLGLSQDKDPARYNTVLLEVELADAIVKAETADGKQIPIGREGFGWERLQKIRDRCGEASLFELVERYREMTSSAPAVQAPFSPSSSPARTGTTSPRRSRPRGSGASRRG